MLSTVLNSVAVPGVLYGVILVLLTVDAFVPIVPTQALMIGGGVLSASTSGHVQLLALVAAGAGGAVSGDLLAFFLGRRLARRDALPGGPVRRQPRAMTMRLTEVMRKHIFLALLFCRFIPAGRMITGMYAGRNGYSIRRFAIYDVVAATIWASYAALLGHFGGQALTSSSWLPLALVGIAAVLFIGGAPLVSLISKRGHRPSARVLDTLASVEPMAAIEVMAAAEEAAASGLVTPVLAP